MRHLDLFSGIGGFHMAARWAGFETIGFSEIEPYCCRLLAEKWPDIRNYGDIRTADFSGLQGRVTVLSAGVPCQPASLAGKRRGSKDDRWLWEAALDVVECVESAWCIFENPPGILTLDEFGGVLLRLESLGYQVRAFSVSANSVGAKHRRQRVFIVANAERIGSEGRQSSCGLFDGFDGPSTRSEALADAASGVRQRQASWSDGYSAQRGEALADADGQRCQSERLAEHSAVQCSRGRIADGRGEGRRREGQTLADADGAQRWQAQPGRDEHHGQETGRGQGTDRPSGVCDQDAADTDSSMRQEQCESEPIQPQFRSAGCNSGQDERLRFGLTQPPLCGRADGVQNRSHRLKALGNAVVPQQAYPFFEAIAQVERGL